MTTPAADDEKVQWAVIWLNDLIRDGRVADLDPDDEYVEWAAQAKAVVTASRLERS